MEQKDHLLGVVQTLWKWRRPILIVTLSAVIGTAIISLFLPNYFKATTIFLAASPDMAKPELLFGQGNLYRNEYGNANDVDRLLTIAESSELVVFLVDSFKLYDHYKIDRENPRAPFKVQEKFFSLYKIEKTKRDAIELSVEDKDRLLAPRIANAAREKIDALAQQLI
ncbi:MAG: Wzz/FepE/Etk N-terminal domain-containing protein, partial [Saprospiraceae bacterium]|nr:Wzz/FepE/Etk N-terminal domain-containing protein [Saprospiraceae bacterium]